jgi:hypothetical protein
MGVRHYVATMRADRTIGLAALAFRSRAAAAMKGFYAKPVFRHKRRQATNDTAASTTASNSSEGINNSSVISLILLSLIFGCSCATRPTNAFPKETNRDVRQLIFRAISASSRRIGVCTNAISRSDGC